MQCHIETFQQSLAHHNDVFLSLDPPESPPTKEEPHESAYLLASHDVERFHRSRPSFGDGYAGRR